MGRPAASSAHTASHAMVVRAGDSSEMTMRRAATRATGPSIPTEPVVRVCPSANPPSDVLLLCGPVRDPIAREFLLAFWKIHILHHAADDRGVYGQWMLEELRHHGYHVSPGTLYPVLARMAERGWLRAAEPKRSKAARVYRITPAGREVLGRVRESLDELYGEVGRRSRMNTENPKLKR